MTGSATERVRVPLGYPTSLIYLDESGSRASASRFFVMAATKLRRPGSLARAVQGVRDRNQFRGEFKFSEITRGTMCAYFDLADELAKSGAHIAACVVNRDTYDPFPGKEPWEAQLEVAAQLLVGCINRRELVSVAIDSISTPIGVALDDKLKDRVNQRLKTTAIVTASALDSRCCDGLQVADLAASAIAFDRRQQAGNAGQPTSNRSPKGKVAARLMDAFERPSFDDCRTPRLNILTLPPPRRKGRAPQATRLIPVRTG